MKPFLISCMGVAMVTAGFVPPMPASAFEASNATGFCQGALPVYDTNIRKRPLAVRNEGTATAFVSCSFPYNLAGLNVQIVVFLVNRNAGALDVACTFVDGAVSEVDPNFPDYYPKTISAAPGVATPIAWTAADYSLANFSRLANLNCALPPGVEISLVYADE